MDKELMAALAPKTDQLNADDLYGVESIVVTIKGPVTVKDGKLNIPLHEMKPYRPSKGMGRILMNLYGDRDNWIGKKLRLYRNPDVKFGGKAVGGIEIKQASNIDGEKNFIVTVARGKKKQHKVSTLVDDYDPVADIKVLFRQACNKDELDIAIEKAKSLSMSAAQKAIITDDYRQAVERISQDVPEKEMDTAPVEEPDLDNKKQQKQKTFPMDL